MKIKVGVIGYGFVGRAISKSFNKNVNLLKIDPKLQTNTRDLKKFSPDIIFICLPTPMREDGDQNIEILNSVLDDLLDIDLTSCTIILKSTVLPSNIEAISKEHPNLIYNPEFLREKSAESDFISAEFHIFGGEIKNCNAASDFYRTYTSTIGEHIFMDISAASFLKYTINSFLSLKVIFFNEIFDLYEKSISSFKWEEFIDILKKDTRLGDSHMSVPGHDGRRGYGGACFPKDSNALHHYSLKNDCELSLLKKSININNKYRSRYNTLTDREIEQKIFFETEEENK